MAVLVAVETVVLVLLAVLVAGLLRSHAEILRRLHTLGAGFETDVSDAAPVALRPRGDVPRTAGLGPAHDIAGPGCATTRCTSRSSTSVTARCSRSSRAAA